MRIYKIKDDMYCRKIRLVVGCKQPELISMLKKHYDVELRSTDSDACYFKMVKDDAVAHVIWIESFDWSIPDQAVVAHEILHLVNRVMNDVGMTLTEESEEAYTWYFQDIFLCIWDKLKVYYTKETKCNEKHKRKK